MNATRVGIISMATNGRMTRSVPRGASCVCDSSSSAASISEKDAKKETCQGTPLSPRGPEERAATDLLVLGDQYQALGSCRGANQPVGGIPRVVVGKLRR